jgi:hypothetical protein
VTGVHTGHRGPHVVSSATGTFWHLGDALDLRLISVEVILMKILVILVKLLGGDVSRTAN